MQSQYHALHYSAVHRAVKTIPAQSSIFLLLYEDRPTNTCKLQNGIIFTALCNIDYSAKSGIAIACPCRLSVTLVDQNHIGWKS